MRAVVVLGLIDISICSTCTTASSGRTVAERENSFDLAYDVLPVMHSVSAVWGYCTCEVAEEFGVVLVLKSSLKDVSLFFIFLVLSS